MELEIHHKYEVKLFYHKNVGWGEIEETPNQVLHTWTLLTSQIAGNFNQKINPQVLQVKISVILIFCIFNDT